MHSNHVGGPLARLALFVLLLAGLSGNGIAQAATRQEIDSGVNAALAHFKKEVQGTDELLRTAKGVLVFEGVIKAGLGIGGEYGEGALRLHGKTAGYYSIASASIGFQLGVQKKDVIILFMQSKALEDFRRSSGWKAGVDGSIALVKVGAGGAVDTRTIKAPIVAFIVGQEGLMYNLTLEGSKITKLKR